jgi:hypothetical protein
MNSEIEQGKALYQIVPAVYRTRDTGSLKQYFQACGLLLDQIRATLDQRLADNFPDNPLDGTPACQDWILPYFADLLDVRLVSPLVKGRRDEVSNAVRWRQGKGTLWVIEEIAEAIGQLEIVLQEGWRRAAATARLNIPRIPATSFGYNQDAPLTPPAMAARHPGLPAVTVDFRCPSGATAAAGSNPGAQQSTVDGDTHIWRQTSYHGAPCHPDSYEDVSRRTVDFRDADWRVGHYHPDRILLYTVPPTGMFVPGSPGVNWSDTPGAAFLNVIDVITENNTTTYRAKTYGTENFVPVRVRRAIRLGQVPGGVGDPDFHTWRFEGLVLENRMEVDSGRVELIDCAARRVEVHSIDPALPVISARDCLIQDLQSARSLSQLDYCTVLETALAEVLLASDCIFLGRIRKDHPTPVAPDDGCVRYSRIRPDQDQGGMRFIDITRQAPIMFSTHYGERSCGVLHPATPAGIRHGAEDGGEMGAYHGDYLSLLSEAVVDKLNDYLPVGLQAVVIPDERLLEMPG